MATINIAGFKKLSDIISEKKLSITDREKVFDRIGTALVGQVQLSFRNSVSPHGEKWKPLKFRRGQPLKDSGRLSNSIAHESSDTKIRIFVEGGLEYASAHNDGVDESQQVKEHTRRITKVFGRNIRPKTISIRSFVRQQDIPQRQFIPNDSRGIPKKWFDIAERLLIDDFKGR